MYEPTNRPPDRHVLVPYVERGMPDRWIIVRKTFEWWAKKGQWFEKDKVRQVGGVIYDDVNAALAERDRLNQQIAEGT